MRACYSREEIARIVAGEGDGAGGEGGRGSSAHAGECPACRARLDEQRALRDLVRTLRAPALSAARRAELGAEVMAIADAAPASRAAHAAFGGASRAAFAMFAAASRTPRVAIAGSLLAAAAAFAIVIGSRGGVSGLAVPAPSPDDQVAVARAFAGPLAAVAHDRALPYTIALDRPLDAPPASVGGGTVPFAGATMPDRDSRRLADARVRSIDTGSLARDVGDPRALADARTASGRDRGALADAANSDPAPSTGRSAAIDARDADATRSAAQGRDTVALRDGAITLDARGTDAVAVVGLDATIRIADAKVRVVARRGAIESVTVFAGSVEVTSPGAAPIRISAGNVWEAPVPDATLVSWRWFRDGWTALRAGRNTDAIAAFDECTAPAVLEDASYWAAVASQRAGDREAALRRFTAFAQRFPTSAHADAARAAMSALR